MPSSVRGELAGVRVVPDANAELRSDGTVIVGGSPLRVIRLSPRGAELVDGLWRGGPVPPGGASTALVRRLLDGGIVHPTWESPPGETAGPTTATTATTVTTALAAEVTTVIPVRGRLDPGLLAALGPVAEIIVVDDASPEAVVVPASTPHGTPIRVVRRAARGGPGAARNRGLDLVTTPFVAFVDADCVPDLGWLDALLPHFTDPVVDAVAPRITAITGTDRGILARYETARSALDMGAQPARVRARSRVAYVPSAALLARTSAIRAVGGFDETLPVGEDVDLIWRLDHDRGTVRYEPRAQVAHHHRTRPIAWLRRRYDYGTSAGPLARRHPGMLAPVELPVRRGAALGEQLASIGDPELAPRLAAQARRAWLRQLARTLVRPWWPTTLLVLALVPSKVVRGALVGIVIGSAIQDWLDEAPPMGLGSFLVARLADDLAYGTGVWVGSVRARTTGPLRPVAPRAAT